MGYTDLLFNLDRHIVFLGEQLDGCTKHLSSKISILYEKILELEQSNRRLEEELNFLSGPHRERERLMRELD